MAYRIVKLGAGEAKVVILPNKCKWKLALTGLRCENMARNAPGAVYCDGHRYLENRACATHDKLGCTKEGCQEQWTS